jgi:uncharacterized protein
MGQIIQLVALIVLLAGAAYMVISIIGNFRIQTASFSAAKAEANFFTARVGEIMDRRKASKAQEDLSWQGFRKFEVAQKEYEGGDICSFYLQPHDHRPLPPFKPGQYLTFRLNIPGEVKHTIRCYSLSCAPDNKRYRISIKKTPPPRDKPDIAPGLVSGHFHNAVNMGDILDVKAPMGHFFMDVSKPHPVVLIGGGIGLTPVLSMLEEIVAKEWRSEIWFFYGVRNAADHIMKNHLKEIAASMENVHLMVCYSDPADDDVKGDDYDVASQVGVKLFKEVLPSKNYQYYFCGPPPMMNALFEDLRAWDIPENHLHYEAFGPATVKKKHEADEHGAEETSESKKAIEHTVKFVKSGITATWKPESDSLLELAEANNVDIEFGCRAGNCGACVTAILKGEVEYLSEPGEMPEAGSCLSCVSIPKSDLEFDA